jgi:putative two-component system response regulator
MISFSEILHGNVLIVDDEEASVLPLERMLRGAGYVSVTSTMDPGEVRELHLRNRYDLILLDLQMPIVDGFQVMEGLREIEPDGYLPVIVITAQPACALRAFQTGAKDFICKPFELAEVLVRVQNMLEVRLLHKKLHGYNHMLEQRVLESTADLRASYLDTIYTMMRAAEYREDSTGAHPLRISSYCRVLAKALDLDKELIDAISFASPMHDLGKIGIPDHVLLKPSGLASDEWEIMKAHAAVGSEILGTSKSPVLKMAAEIALNHHERWDGGGYPSGRCGEAIPMTARIMTVCDVYDALRSRRPYKPALSHLKAVEAISRGDGRTQPEQFDPNVLAVFLENHRSFRDVFEAYAT